MHASLEQLIKDAESAVKANELERAHLRALGAHRKTLAAMKRDGISGPDMLLTITKLRQIAARPLTGFDDVTGSPLFNIAAAE